MSDTRFTRDHEWVRLADGVATVGITDHAQSQLGDIVYVELPTPGRAVAAGEACAVVESVKAASDVFAPIAGRITEVNAALADDPGLVNREPQDAGWFFRLIPTDAAALDALMDEDAYKKFVEET